MAPGKKFGQNIFRGESITDSGGIKEIISELVLLSSILGLKIK